MMDGLGKEVLALTPYVQIPKPLDSKVIEDIITIINEEEEN